MFVGKTESYTVENITVYCDERCPIFYCNNPCRIKEHVKKYSQVMNEEGSFTIL